jgi:hypothetical protein
MRRTASGQLVLVGLWSLVFGLWSLLISPLLAGTITMKLVVRVNSIKRDVVWLGLRVVLLCIQSLRW